MKVNLITVMRLVFLAMLATMSSLLCFGLSSCCHNKDKEQENKGAVIGVSPTLDKKMTHDIPLYKYLMTNQIGYKAETRQFLDRIKAKHKPTELQHWALEILDAHNNDKEPLNLSRKEIPDFILQLDPPLEPFVTIHPKSYVTIGWGGGFGFWGLFLAESNSKPPDNPAVYVIEWAPGVQVFHDIQ